LTSGHLAPIVLDQYFWCAPVGGPSSQCSQTSTVAGLWLDQWWTPVAGPSSPCSTSTLKLWLWHNGLLFNPDKSFAALFGTRQCLAKTAGRPTSLWPLLDCGYRVAECGVGEPSARIADYCMLLPVGTTLKAQQFACYRILLPLGIKYNNSNKSIIPLLTIFLTVKI